MRLLKLFRELECPTFLLLALFTAATTSFATASTQASAAEPQLEVIDSTDFPWHSIGRVNFAGYRTTSTCTGTLVAPKIVLTAAHCLYNAKTKKHLPADELLFIAGVRRDEYAARLEADCILTPEDYAPQGRIKIQDIRNDFGIIVLKEESTLAPVPPLQLEDLALFNKGTRFQSVGYRRSRSFLPTAVAACGILGVVQNSWVTNCPTESGASGGPFLLETPEGVRVAGLTSAKIDDQRSVIVPFLQWRDFLENATCPSAVSQPQ